MDTPFGSAPTHQPDAPARALTGASGWCRVVPALFSFGLPPRRRDGPELHGVDPHVVVPGSRVPVHGPETQKVLAFAEVERAQLDPAGGDDVRVKAVEGLADRVPVQGYLDDAEVGRPG